MEFPDDNRVSISEPNKFPNLLQTIGLLMLVFMLQIAIVVPIAAFGRQTGTDPTDHPATIALVNAVSIGLVLLFGLKKTGGNFKRVFPLKPVTPALYLATGITMVGAGILLSEVDNLVRSFFPVPEFVADAFNRLLGAESNVYAAFLAIAVVAPLTEELLFRGLILRGFLLNYGTRTAVLLSALLFALFHLNPWQFLGAFAAGLLFAWWFVATGSLLLCIFAHALNNALPIILTRVLAIDIPGYTDELSGQVQHQPLWFDSLGLGLLALGIVISVRLFEQSRDRDR